MLYMVETGFDDAAREAAFNAWYDGEKTAQLLAIPGFHATQRFYDRQPSAQPYLAIHSIVGPKLFSSAAYKAGGGGTVGPWEDIMTRGGWTRRLFAGIDAFPGVPVDWSLVVVDGAAAPDLPAAMLWVRAVDWQRDTAYDGAKALDSSLPRRGLAMLHPDAAANVPVSAAVRVFKPISAWRTGTAFGDEP